MKMNNTYRSKVYTERPDYADFDAPAKFEAIKSIIAKRLTQHPKAICSYSGGSDSDILIDLIERTRAMMDYQLPPVKYVFFNTGLEMQAIKEHVKGTAKKYNIEIETIKPKKNIITSVREYGVPFMSKRMSQGLEAWQRKKIPLSVVSEIERSENKRNKMRELTQRYPRSQSLIGFLSGYDKEGIMFPNKQFTINASKYMYDFICTHPPDFKISAKCCDYCKKEPAHRIQKDYEMIITGERMSEGGPRAAGTCFNECKDGKFKLRPLFYVNSADKQWYKEYYGIKYSDAYEVYGLTRTGCCGCPISYKAVDDLELIRPYEPNVVKAAWSIFGKSYEYRKKYNEYKAKRREQD